MTYEFARSYSPVMYFVSMPVPGFRVGAFSCRKCAIDEYVRKIDALVRQRLQHEILRRVERLFGKALGSQAVLVRHHHELVIGLRAILARFVIAPGRNRSFSRTGPPENPRARE